jgi:hypothetical protein
MNAKLFTFKTNQTIIAEVVGETDTTVSLKQPVQVIAQPNQAGQAMLGFAPFLDFSDNFKKGIEFKKSDLLTITEPVSDLANEYNRIFGLGLITASTMPKI